MCIAPETRMSAHIHCKKYQTVQFYQIWLTLTVIKGYNEQRYKLELRGKCAPKNSKHEYQNSGVCSTI